MASISPPDTSTINYYKKLISDVEDQRQNEAKRNRRERTEEVEHLQKGYQSDLVKREEENSRLLREQAQGHDEAFTREQDRQSQELERLKANYNARGESTVPYDQYKRAVEEFNKAQDQMKVDYDRIQTAHNEEAENLRTSYDTAIVSKEKGLNEALKNTSQSYSESLDNEREKYQGELDRLKANYTNKGEMGVPLDVHKRELETLNKDMELRHKVDIQNQDAIRDEGFARINENERKTSQQIANLRDQQVQEVRNMNDQVRDLTNYNGKLDKEKGEYLANLTRETDRNQQAEFRRLTDNYEKNLGTLKQNLNNSEDYYSRLNRDIIRNKEAQSAELIRQTTAEAYQTQQELQNTFKDQVNRLETQKKEQEEKSDQALQRQLSESNQTREQMLTEKSRQYSEEAEKIRKTDEEKIGQLQRALQVQKTTSDTTLLSPAAEDTFRKTYAREYDKSLNTEVQKNKIEYENLQSKYSRQYQDALEEFGDKTTSAIQENQRDRANERAQLMSSIDETQYNTDAKLHEQEADHDRERDHLYRQFGSMLEKQKNEYSHIFETMRADSDLKLTNFRQDADLAMKNVQRESKTRQTEMVREYEKKLADQKRESDAAIDDLKTQAQLDLRAKDKSNKNELEAQAKGYEQRLAQLEALNKERERNIAQSYQDELDKTRRSYELLAQKKS